MPHYSYSGRNAQGALVTGTLEAANAQLLADHLAQNGLTPVRIDEGRAPARSALETIRTYLKRTPVGYLDVLMFSRQMHTLLKAGVPIMRALAGLQESATNPSFAEVIKDLRDSLDAGRETSQALARQPKVFNGFYVAMIQVGETTGRLEEVFLRLFHHLEFQQFMRQQVKSALRYPAFVILAMAIAMVIINIFVIPTFAKVFKGMNAELPFMTRFLIEFSNFTVTWWPLLAALVAAGIGGFTMMLKNPAGLLMWDRAKLRFPIAGEIIRKATLARFARSFSLSMRSGVPVVQGLTLTAQVVENAYLAKKIDEMRLAVEQGSSVLRAAANSKVFTPVVLQMIMVGEESGSLDELMQEIADMYQREVEYDLKNLSAQIEPVLIVALGVMVLVLALGIFLPMWDFGKAAIK